MPGMTVVQEVSEAQVVRRLDASRIVAAREIERLQSLGGTAMGVFPAATLGGRQFLEAIAGPYPRRLVPPGRRDPHLTVAAMALDEVEQPANPYS
jgi:2-keto-3-deoxy-6-phosphogluconate aldolase